MAGSYRHVTNSQGEFVGLDLIDNLGDAHEALEECVEMIHYLAKGNLQAIYRAHREGHLMKHNPDRVREERLDPGRFEAEFWGED